MLGLCAGEAGGLTRRPSSEVLKEIETTPGLTAMPALLPSIRRLDPKDVFETQLVIMLDGIEALAKGAEAGRVAQHGKRA